jgi:Mrp family chromosome partitioning ATPase/capsular polysaccharide biosynthesis protein
MRQPPLRHYLDVLRRHAYVVIALPLVALALAAFVTSRQESIYHADMSVFVGQAGGGITPAIGTQPLTQTMTNLFESNVVARTAIRRLRIDVTPKDVAKRLTVAVQPDSSVLEIGLDWPDRRQAVALLGAMASVFTEQVRMKLGLSTSGGALDNASAKVVFFTKVFDPPHLLPDRVSPRLAKTLAFAGVLGLLLGLIFAFVRESVDDRIRGRREAETAFGAPVIGALPRGAQKRPLATLSSTQRDRRGVREAVRLMRANLWFSRSGLDGPTVLVTSSEQNEGKTTVTACVALALALGGKRVVCVDADMRSPRLHRVLGLEAAGAGLAEVISGDLDVEEALRPVPLTLPAVNGHAVHVNGNGNANGAVARNGNRAPSAVHGSLLLLTAGERRTGDVMVDAETIERLVERLAADADYVIFDSPPLLSSGDAFPFAMQSDAVILAARDGRTTKIEAEAARRTLKGHGARRVSVVLTGTAAHRTYPERTA